MSWMFKNRLLACCALLVIFAGCANRRWGFAGGQGTTERQKSRAALHDPYPLNDIGPEVVGGRPREFANPSAEPVREHITEPRFPASFTFPGR